MLVRNPASLELEPYKIGCLEEPRRPERIQALTAVREQVRVPIYVGEWLYARHEFLPLLDQGLTDHIMPDMVWTGGTSETLRIATVPSRKATRLIPRQGWIDGSGELHVRARDV